LSEKNEVLLSLSKEYKNSYIKKNIIKFKNYSTINIIGMGGSILGAKAIYNFLKIKSDKRFFFIDGFRKRRRKEYCR
jgi:glucose-6-phosphate isomerase